MSRAPRGALGAARAAGRGRGRPGACCRRPGRRGRDAGWPPRWPGPRVSAPRESRVAPRRRALPTRVPGARCPRAPSGAWESRAGDTQGRGAGCVTSRGCPLRHPVPGRLPWRRSLPASGLAPDSWIPNRGGRPRGHCSAAPFCSSREVVPGVWGSGWTVSSCSDQSEELCSPLVGGGVRDLGGPSAPPAAWWPSPGPCGTLGDQRPSGLGRAGTCPGSSALCRFLRILQRESFASLHFGASTHSRERGFP